jgi:hypothetical protein
MPVKAITRKVKYPRLSLSIFLKNTSIASIIIAKTVIIMIGEILFKSNGGITISIN